jgi:hypothetical protein
MDGQSVRRGQQLAKRSEVVEGSALRGAPYSPRAAPTALTEGQPTDARPQPQLHGTKVIESQIAVKTAWALRFQC